jgi:hypothetical protein
MTRIGKLWTDSVAYVALAIGAGLSIAGNVADTYRVRGQAVDTLDIVMAVAWPALVVLMVEIFVSTRWRGLGLAMQCLRWLGCLSIGAMAMRVSWVHLNDLMLSRGQMADVAILGPLAIDALAIMATALILAGRGQPRVQDKPMDIDLDSTLAKWTAPSDWDMARATELAEDMASLDRERAVTLATQEDADTTAAILANPLAYLISPDVAEDTRPVSPAGARISPDRVPDTARDMLATWSLSSPAERPRVGQADEAVAAAHGVSTRTARGWRTALGIRS